MFLEHLMLNIQNLKKHLEKEMMKPEWLFKEVNGNKIIKIYKPKSLKQTPRENIRLDDKQLNKEVANEMLNPYYFTDRVGFNFNLDSHHINHASSKITFNLSYPKFGIETRINNKILKEMAKIYARLITQYKFKYQVVFSARFDKQDDINQMIDEVELFIDLNINHNQTESDIDKIDIKSPLENQIHQQAMKNFG